MRRPSSSAQQQQQPPQPPKKKKTIHDFDASHASLHELRRMNYFDLFGVARTATAADVRAAFKQLSVRYHPDKNRANADAAAIFVHLKSARDALDTDAKVDIYRADIEISELSDASAFGATMRMSAVARDALDAHLKSGGGQMWGSKRRRVVTKTKTRPLVHTLALTLEELDDGCIVQHRYKCVRFTSERNEVEYALTAAVTVPPASRDGDRIVHEEAGNHYPGYLASDLVFVLTQKPHAVFSNACAASGDVHMRVAVNPLEMLAGKHTTVTCLNGRRVALELKPPLRVGDERRFAGLGARVKRLATGDPDDERGKLIVHIEQSADDLSAEQRAVVDELFNKLKRGDEYTRCCC